MIYRFVAPSRRPRAVAEHAVDALAQAGLSPRLDLEAAQSYLTWAEFDAHRTFFEDVVAVPWGVLVRRRLDGTLGLRIGPGPRRLDLTTEAAAGAVRRAVRAAVEEALASHARAAVLLSGGLDSSVVASAAAASWRRLDRDPAHLRFYHRLPPRGPSEVGHARALAEALGHRLVEVPTPGGDQLSGLEAVLRRLSHPVDDVEPGASLALVRATADEGATVYLTGDGGDELFAHYAARAYVGGGGRGPVQRAGRVLNWHLAARGLPRLSRPPPWGRGRPSPPWTVSFLAPPHPQHQPPPRRGIGGERAWRDRTVRCARQHILMDWHRALGAVAGIEACAPLLDRRVVDLALSLHPMHFRGRLPKSLLRRAFVDQLPPPQRARPKDQPLWEPHIQRALGDHGSAWTADYLQDGLLVARGLLDPRRVGGLLELAAQGPLHWLNAGMAALCLEVWARAHEVG